MAGLASISKISYSLQMYDKLREQKKQLEAELKKLGTQIQDYAKEFGVEDDKGSLYAETPEFIYGSQARKSVNFKDEAKDYFKSVPLLNDCIKTVEVLDEKAIESHLKTGAITYDDIEQLTTVKVTYAISVVKKEAVEDVEVHQFAASEKRPVKLFNKKG